MEFHRRAFELFGGQDFPLDPARGQAVRRLATTAGVALPAAVAEWYSLPTTSPAWRALNRLDESLLRCDGDDPTKWWFGRPIGRGESTNNPWAAPPVCHDLRGWIADPILPLMAECCGGWWWGVALNGADDPPMVITHDEGETWDLGARSFSLYVYATLFDDVFHNAERWGREIVLEGHRVEDPVRRLLREQFQAEPTTRVPYPFASELTERYSRDGQRVSVANLETPAGCRTRPDCRWRLWAADRERFDDLVARLARLVPALAGVTPGERGDVGRAGLPRNRGE